MSDPNKFYDTQQGAARDQVNEDFSGVDDSLRQQFLTGGGGEGSGKYGKAALATDLSRRSKLADTDTQFAQAKANAPLTAAQLAQQFLGLNFGQSSKGSTGATTTGSSGATTTSTDASSGTSGTSGSTTQQTNNQTQGTGKQTSVSAGVSLI